MYSVITYIFINHCKIFGKTRKHHSGMRNWRLISLEGNKRETGRAAVASQPQTGRDVNLVLPSQRVWSLWATESKSCSLRAAIRENNGQRFVRGNCFFFIVSLSVGATSGMSRSVNNVRFPAGKQAYVHGVWWVTYGTHLKLKLLCAQLKLAC